jgi:hypothetical protein
MSLRDFHILFVNLSVLLSLGFSYWAFQQNKLTGAQGYRVVGLISLIVAAGLVIYVIRFAKRVKN